PATVLPALLPLPYNGQTMRNGHGMSGVSAAFVIGVETAQDDLRPPARHAAADASALAAAFEVEVDRRVLLLDGSATKTAIESRLRKWTADLRADDLPAIFFSGYGFSADGVNFLVVHDTQPDDFVATSIPLTAIVDSLMGLAVFFLDLRPLPQRPVQIADFSPDELDQSFGDSETKLAFVSRSAGQDSHVSDTLKHSVWSHLLAEAFAGNAPAALDGRQRITPRSLQPYLTDELPRVLRQVLERPAEQTPAMCGRPAAGCVLADLGPKLRARRSAGGLTGGHLERIVLWSETRTRVKDLAGFEKTHHMPDRVRPATVRFIAAIAREDLQADLDAAYAAVREHLGYRRKDIVVPPPTDGSGGLRTPDFDYLISVSLSDDDPTTVVVRREVTHLQSADLLRRPAFQAAFGCGFQALSFEYAAPLGVERLVDRVEDDPPAGASVRCSADGSWCELELSGFPGTIRIEGNRLMIQGRRLGGPNALWAAFEAFRDLFNRATEPKALPPAGR
ncbi:MAG TPA: hypothetical protein VH120_20845, partial [Gemmataceae bacterium]|nr:hypothetical protein [Gemmataceae bacterium]